MMKNKQLFTIIAIIIGLSSCKTTYRYIYTASPANNPYFTQKGESELKGNYSSSNHNQITNKFANGFDVQAAYAFTNNWAITTGYYNRRGKDIFSYTPEGPFESSVINYKRNLVDIGGGYFVSLNKSKTITFNLYSGLALGKFSFTDNGIDNDSANYRRYQKNKITKWYIQPSFNFMPGKYFRLSYAFKFSFVHYGYNQTSYTPDEIKQLSLNLIDNQTLSFIEPSMNLQFGLPEYPWIKLDAGISWTTNPSNIVIYNNWLKVRGFSASIGLNFDFSKLKKK